MQDKKKKKKKIQESSFSKFDRWKIEWGKTSSFENRACPPGWKERMCTYIRVFHRKEVNGHTWYSRGYLFRSRTRSTFWNEASEVQFGFNFTPRAVIPWITVYIYIYNILHIGETRVSKHSKFPKISYLIRVIIFPLIFPTLTLWYLYLFIFGSFKMA